MSVEKSLEHQLANLWDAVLNLALPADDQLAILDALGDRQAIDELALAFDDVFWVVQEAFEQNLISTAEKDVLDDLNSTLDEMSGSVNADKWTSEALVNDNVWEKVRRLARNALAQRQVARLQNASA